MFKELNQTCKKVNDALGVSVKLPEPRKSTLKATATLNGVVGTGLVVTGLVCSSKWCLAIGGLGIVSSIVQRHESKSVK